MMIPTDNDWMARGALSKQVQIGCACTCVFVCDLKSGHTNQYHQMAPCRSLVITEQDVE